MASNYYHHLLLQIIMVRSLDLKPPSNLVLLIRPIFTVIVGIIFFFLTNQDPFFLIFISLAILGTTVQSLVDYSRYVKTKHNFLVKGNLITYTKKKGYKTLVSEEIYLKELILNMREGSHNGRSSKSPDRYMIQKSNDDSFELKIDAMRFGDNLQIFTEFLSLQRTQVPRGYNWTCKSFDENALPSMQRSEDYTLDVGTMIFMGIFSFFWVGFCSLMNVLLIFGSVENRIFVLAILSPFNLVSVVIVVYWVKKLFVSPKPNENEEEVESGIELRAISSSKKDNSH